MTTMDQSVSAFLIGAGIGAYGFLWGNKVCHDEIECEKNKRRNLLIESRERKFSLEKRLKAQEEEISSLAATLTAEQDKVQTYAAENEDLEMAIAQKNDEIVELKMFSKDLKTALALATSKETQQDSEIARLTAALKAEEEKTAILQTELLITTKGKTNGDAAVKAKGGKVAITATVPEAAGVTGKADGEGRRKSFLGLF